MTSALSVFVFSAALAGFACLLQGCGSSQSDNGPGKHPKTQLPCSGKATADDVLAGITGWNGTVAIVTGGDSGLGYSIAMALAKKNVAVVLASHNQSKTEAAASKIKKATGNSQVHAFHLDLSSLDSAREFVANFSKSFSKLNFLINDAGIGHPSKQSKDGYELVFEVDYLGHFLITDMLLPMLRISSPARIVNVASGAHENACESAGWKEGCFSDWKYLPPPVIPVKNVTVHYRSGAANVTSSSYGIAKFLNIQHAAALATLEKKSGVEAFSMTPGFALTAMTSHFDPHSGSAKVLCEEQIHPDPSIPANECPFTADEGAAPIAFCLTGKARSGAYYSRTWACEERPVTMHGFTKQMQIELYNRSRTWAHLTPLPSSDATTLVV